MADFVQLDKEILETRDKIITKFFILSKKLASSSVEDMHRPVNILNKDSSELKALEFLIRKFQKIVMDNPERYRIKTLTFIESSKIFYDVFLNFLKSSDDDLFVKLEIFVLKLKKYFKVNFIKDKKSSFDELFARFDTIISNYSKTSLDNDFKEDTRNLNFAVMEIINKFAFEILFSFKEYESSRVESVRDSDTMKHTFHSVLIPLFDEIKYLKNKNLKMYGEKHQLFLNNFLIKLTPLMEDFKALLYSKNGDFNIYFNSFYFSLSNFLDAYPVDGKGELVKKDLIYFDELHRKVMNEFAFDRDPKVVLREVLKKLGSIADSGDFFNLPHNFLLKKIIEIKHLNIEISHNEKMMKFSIEILKDFIIKINHLLNLRRKKLTELKESSNIVDREFLLKLSSQYKGTINQLGEILSVMK